MLKHAFALFLVVMGSFMLYQNRTVFLPGARQTHAVGTHVKHTSEVQVRLPLPQLTRG
jgi:hypothetical protein